MRSRRTAGDEDIENKDRGSGKFKISSIANEKRSGNESECKGLCNRGITMGLIPMASQYLVEWGNPIPRRRASVIGLNVGEIGCEDIKMNKGDKINMVSLRKESVREGVG